MSFPEDQAKERMCVNSEYTCVFCRVSQSEKPETERIRVPTLVSTMSDRAIESERDQRYCGSCGNAIGRGNTFCPDCGAKQTGQARQPRQQGVRQEQAERTARHQSGGETTQRGGQSHGSSGRHPRDGTVPPERGTPETEQTTVDRVATGAAWVGVVLASLLAVGTVTESVSGMPVRMSAATGIYLLLALFTAPVVRAHATDRFDLEIPRSVVVAAFFIVILANEALVSPPIQ